MAGSFRSVARRSRTRRASTYLPTSGRSATSLRRGRSSHISPSQRTWASDSRARSVSGAAGSIRRSTSSGSLLATPVRGHTSYRAASSAASRSPAHWRRALRSFSWTSRFPGWTRHCVARPERRCWTLWPQPRLPQYLSHTTRAKRFRWVGRSPFFAMASWSRRPTPRRSTALPPTSIWRGLSATPWS